MARTHSLIGSALFLVLAPGTVGLLVPHLIKLATPRAALPVAAPTPSLARGLISGIRRRLGL